MTLNSPPIFPKPYPYSSTSIAMSIYSIQSLVLRKHRTNQLAIQKNPPLPNYHKNFSSICKVLCWPSSVYRTSDLSISLCELRYRWLVLTPTFHPSLPSLTTYFFTLSLFPFIELYWPLPIPSMCQVLSVSSPHWGSGSSLSFRLISLTPLSEVSGSLRINYCKPHND